MSKLASLHSQLTTLKHTRATVRLVTAFAALATAILWALIGIFILDFAFELPLLPRLIVMVIGALASFWAFTKYTRPMLGVEETELDMALMVERQQRIDSDLVAALQFEAPEAADWGSRQLEGAVIDYVAEFGNALNVFEGFNREQMTRRATVLGVTALVIVAFVLVAPTHAGVFFNRLLMGHRHYPSDTKIEQVLVNDLAVLSAADGSALPKTVKGAQGQPMLFYVQCSGDLPSTGTLRVRSINGGPARPVEMKTLTLDERATLLRTAQTRLEEAIAKDDVDVSTPWQNNVAALTAFDAPEVATRLRDLKSDRAQLPELLTEVKQTLAAWPAKADKTAVYLGDMGRLVDEVRYSLYVGDAWTDPALVRMIPLPVVELVPTIIAPKYARNVKDEEPQTSRQISVLEGSDVELTLNSVNKKPLKEAWLIAKGKEKAQRIAMVKQDDKGLTWALPLQNSPFKRVSQEIRYEIQVTDEDDLNLDSPIRGTVRLRTDRPPNGTARVVHRVVLPTAKPRIEYRLNDDYGIAKLTLQVQIQRNPEALGTPEPGATEPAAATEEDKKVVFTLHAPPKPPIPTPSPVAGQYALNLSPLMLAKGDRLKLTLEITDDRGETPGQTYLSDPIVLEISDESGVLAAIGEADERSEQRMTDIIKKQLGIGESP
jgi:hypothetical protein